MTTSKVVFDPFSSDFFNAPYATYRRMRDEEPVYYSENYDFYALTRHADVVAAIKDSETFSSSRGVDLEMVQSGNPVPPLIIMMDPPEHRRMRNLVNKVFTPRAVERQRQLVVEQIDRFLAATNPDEFDVVQDFSALFPGGSDHPDAWRACRAPPDRSGFCWTRCSSGSTATSRRPRKVFRPVSRPD